MATVLRRSKPRIWRSLGALNSALAGRISILYVMRYCLIGIIYIGLYFAINAISRNFEFSRLGVTLWSLDAGLSFVLLLALGEAFAPLIFLASVLTEIIIYGFSLNIYAILLTGLVLTLEYVAIAAALRLLVQFDLRRSRLKDVVALLTVVPVCTTVAAALYCGALYVTGELPAGQFFLTARYTWIGEMVGIVTLVPAVTAVLLLVSSAHFRLRRAMLIDVAVFIAVSCFGFSIIFGVEATDQHQFLYLLFLPITWIGLRQGFAGVAIALLVTHLALVATTMLLQYHSQEFVVFQMFMFVLSATGLPLGVVISERTQAAAVLSEQQTELARVSAHARAGAMGTALAHEISQPLSTVATYLHAARRMLHSGTARAKVSGALGKAESEAQRAREILERLRDFISTGRMELERIDLAKLVAKIASLYREEATALGIEIKVHGDRQVPLVRADEIHIEQVLNNLVANAIDAAAERSHRGGVIALRLVRSGDRVAINVEDNGPGVAAEVASRLFEPYQTTKPKGLGLGLPLSRQIAEMHAGRLWWEPMAPEGTRFVLELHIDGPSQDAR